MATKERERKGGRGEERKKGGKKEGRKERRQEKKEEERTKGSGMKKECGLDVTMTAIFEDGGRDCHQRNGEEEEGGQAEDNSK